MIDCMTCLIQLAQGCPTNGRTNTFHGVTHALVTIVGTHVPGPEDVRAHGFRWSKISGRWMFFVGIKSHWVILDQG